MAYNIQFQLCGLIMVFMVMYFYFSNKTLKLSSEKAYSYLLLTVAICLSLDILSVVVLNHKEKLPTLLTDAIAKAYTLSICIVAFSTRVYVCASIYGKKLSRKQKNYYGFPMGIAIIGTCLFPIYSHVSEGRVYTYGSVINLTYLVVSCYLITSILAVIRHRTAMNSDQFYAINFLLFSWIITAIIQFIKNEWLLVGFAMSAAMVFMYFCLENPAHNIDNRTGVFNQQAYQLHLKNLFHKNKDFILVILDIGDMGFVTETFGIQNTELLMQDIAKFLDSQFKGKIFRTHEYRFTVVFEDSLETISEKIATIKGRVQQPWIIANMEYTLHTYMVQIQSSVCDLTMEKVAEFSRYFLSEAKKQGKDTFLLVSKEHAAQKDEGTLVEKAIQHAILNKEIQVFYQPIYSIDENRYVSAEALTRIRDFNGEYIPPDLFIKIAEQNGMILELGMLIFEEVCRYIHNNSLEEKGIQYIEINLSVVQCMQEKLADELLQMMKKYQVPPSFINLEITETAAIESDTILKKNMDKLMQKGVSFSLDDYGNGYSNLAYVMDLPVRLIKLDKSMVQAYCEAEKVRVAMEFTILMIKKLGIQVVAEGVETEEQLEEMKKLNIDFIQGYYFSRPLEKSDFDKIINNG